jgi:ABC-type Zn uptake system ZnuABC Zn-binding protein ZnuA
MLPGAIAALGHAQSATEPLQVVTTVPELGSLVHEIGGEQVVVTVLAKGTEDPHFVEAKPSFIKALSQADMYVQVGLEAEIGWAPVLLQQARNANVLPGAPGYIDAATVITPLEVPTGRGPPMGMTPFGNPTTYLILARPQAAQLLVISSWPCGQRRAYFERAMRPSGNARHCPGGRSTGQVRRGKASLAL